VNDNKIEWHYIDPHFCACKHALPCSGTGPQQNGYIKSLIGSLRDECLNEEPFDNLADARRSLAS